MSDNLRRIHFGLTPAQAERIVNGAMAAGLESEPDAPDPAWDKSQL